MRRCEGSEVIVVGGGNSAGQAAVYLAGKGVAAAVGEGSACVQQVHQAVHD